jgi:hypothetical protein
VSTDAPKVNLFGGTGIADGAAIGRVEGAGQPDAIRDAGQPDAISEAVGRPGYIFPYEVALDDGQEPVMFERYYYAADAGEAVFVDAVSGGIERAPQEAKKQVAAKRSWCKKRGVKYMVFVEDTVTV